MTDEVNGWLFPDDVEVPSEPWFRIPFGDDDEVRDMSWHGHVDVAHQQGIDQLQTEVADSGIDDDGIRYAAVKASVVIDGTRYESLAGADEASRQVRDPEHVWSVAESRAVKRAVKKALNIRPASDSAAKADDETYVEDPPQASGGSVEVAGDGTVEVTPPEDHATDDAGSEW